MNNGKTKYINKLLCIKKENTGKYETKIYVSQRGKRDLKSKT